MRPKINYNQAVVKQAVEIFKKNDYKMSGIDLQAGEHAIVLTNYPAKYSIQDIEENPVIATLNEGNPDAGFV